MQDNNSEIFSGTFCGVCRHPSNVPPGHDPDCPVLTGAPVSGGLRAQDYQPFPGLDVPLEQNPLNLQQQQGPVNMLQQLGGIGRVSRQAQEDGYEVAKIYREARERILEELKMQVEINHRQGRELIELRLELQEAHEVVKCMAEEINTLRTSGVDDNPPF